MKKLITAMLVLILAINTFPVSAFATNNWVQENNAWHVYQDGQMVKKDWYQDNGKWYYLDNHGEITTGWIFIDHIWYYMGTDGVMKTGWQLIDNNWYYFRNNGQMFVGWLQVKSGAPWYYLNSSGKMVVGWQQIDGKWYYFDSTGKMLKNTTVDDCKLGADGAWIENNTNNKYSLSHDKKLYFYDTYYPEDVIYATMLTANHSRNNALFPKDYVVEDAVCYKMPENSRYFIAITAYLKKSNKTYESEILYYIFNTSTLDITPFDLWTIEDTLSAFSAVGNLEYWYFSGNSINKGLATLN